MPSDADEPVKCSSSRGSKTAAFVAPTKEENEQHIMKLPDPFWQASLLLHFKSGESDAEVKEAFISDHNNQALVAALLITIVVALLLTPKSDYAEGALEGCWLVKVYFTSAITTIMALMLCLYVSVQRLLFINQVPPCLIYEYIARMQSIPTLKAGFHPLVYMGIGFVALVPTLASGVFVTTGSVAHAWGALAAGLFTMLHMVVSFMGYGACNMTLYRDKLGMAESKGWIFAVLHKKSSGLGLERNLRIHPEVPGTAA